jgi:hypothetical protein
MVAQKSTVTPDSYRVDVVRGAQGDTFQVVRCEAVARFDNEEHAAFLVDLLLKGQTDDQR